VQCHCDTQQHGKVVLRKRKVLPLLEYGVADFGTALELIDQRNTVADRSICSCQCKPSASRLLQVADIGAGCCMHAVGDRDIGSRGDLTLKERDSLLSLAGPVRPATR